MHLFSTLPGIIIVHTIFGMPVLVLLFRNFYAGIPIELFKASRVDGAGFWQTFFYIMLPMSVPITTVALILQVTGIWNDFLFGVIFAGRPNWPMTVQLHQHRQDDAGHSAIRRQHGCDHRGRGGSVDHLFRFGSLVRARHRRRRSKGLTAWHKYQVRDLDISFGALKVLQQLNVTAEDGEFLVLLGPSGCGKSTLLNAIAGLLDINGGQIFIGGKNVTWEEPKDRGIGMVFQSYALYPHDDASRKICPSACASPASRRTRSSAA